MISKRQSVFSLAFIVLFTFTSILPLLEAKEGLEGKQGVSAEEGYQLSSMMFVLKIIMGNGAPIIPPANTCVAQYSV